MPTRGERFFFSFCLIDWLFVIAEFNIRNCLLLFTLSLLCAEVKKSQSREVGSHVIVVGLEVKSILPRGKK